MLSADTVSNVASNILAPSLPFSFYRCSISYFSHLL